MTLSRRRYLAALGGSAGVALAGCGGGDVNRTTYEAESVSAPEEVSDYVSASSNFDGTMVDLTGRDEIEVTVGVQGNGSYYAFGPPAITVSTGTTVTWRWTGRGNAHNVASQGGGPLNSSLTAEEGHTYDHTFEQSGVYLYKCNPHEFQGMKGAVVVE
ncbi:halocyanin domain-containing protein [Halapricum salinum]|uniref:Halocyanin domain-containing protein n=1 Tax=Halapricum salinum TaxID=1457250 RepID=A0A4D6HF62_9EURY|nr:halocyanin domain-containing protein [Halapricum salinum]QCC52659.1 halocyanin domain-containing protein [Halapricum salinum]